MRALLITRRNNQIYVVDLRRGTHSRATSYITLNDGVVGEKRFNSRERVPCSGPMSVETFMTFIVARQTVRYVAYEADDAMLSLLSLIMSRERGGDREKNSANKKKKCGESKRQLRYLPLGELCHVSLTGSADHATPSSGSLI